MRETPTPRRLDSWKEIAEYLGRELRTVMRWEQDRGLPVRRVPGGKRSAVFAYAQEIDDWMARGDGRVEAASEGATAAGTADPSGPELSPGAPESALLVSAGRRQRIAFAGVALIAVLLVAALYLPVRRKPLGAAQMPHEVSFEGAVGGPRFLRSDFELGVRPYRIRAGDFNEDGKADLVFSSAPNDQIGVLLGKGGGVFSSPRLYEGCPSSDGLVVADFNHDGHADVAVSCMLGNKVMFFWGKGDGTFSDRTTIEVPGGPRDMAVGDVGQDGWPDVAVATSQGALYYLKNAGGKLTPSLIAHFDLVTFPVFADWDGDGTPDLLTGLAIHGQAGVGLLPGKKDGSLGPMQWLVELPAAPGTVVVGDFDGSGGRSLVVEGWEDLRVYLHRGAGQPPELIQEFRDRTQSWFVHAADLDGDGKPDLLGCNVAQGTLLFFRGLGGGKFAEPAQMLLGSYSQPALVADLDGDGKFEIVVPTYTKNAVIVLKTR